ncbi:uncharacterized protein, partial [Argopecten irradians]|uniref:uncharacterized protein n=1 Tax=Argopecten irradians TaxID=31199 RepID=UPI00371C4967
MSDPDKGCQMIFNITNDIDIKRRKTNNDITDTFERVTRCEHGRVETNLQQKCIQVSLNITPAEKPLRPSSVYLAEEFKHFLLNGGTIQLSDESRTMLQIDKNSFEIIPLDAPEGGSPWINISHGMFVVTVGKTATIQTFIIASPEVTSVQWYRVDKDEYIPLQIDNKRYFAGSILSPTLIIRETIIEDQGEYVCSATNSNGPGWSGIATLTVESEARNQSTDANLDPSQKILKGEDMDVFDESKLSLDKETAGKYIADSGTVSSKEHLLVGAIDFGTTYSGYAFSWQADYKQYPLRIFTNTWSEGSSALMSSKTPTCVLFKPDGTFHSFGYEAEDKYAELALEEEQEGWRYFRRFKMKL